MQILAYFAQLNFCNCNVLTILLGIYIYGCKICMSYMNCESSGNRKIYCCIVWANVDQPIRSTNIILNSHYRTVELFSLKIKSILNNQLNKNFGFIFLNRKIKQTSRRQIFTDLNSRKLINTKINFTKSILQKS